MKVKKRVVIKYFQRDDSMKTPDDLEMGVYDGLKGLSTSVEAFGELKDLIPSDDRYASLFGCLVERLESDFTSLHLSCVQYIADNSGSLK